MNKINKIIYNLKQDIDKNTTKYIMIVGGIAILGIII